jgi:hypothetical protein
MKNNINNEVKKILGNKKVYAVSYFRNLSEELIEIFKKGSNDLEENNCALIFVNVNNDKCEFILIEGGQNDYRITDIPYYDKGQNFYLLDLIKWHRTVYPDIIIPYDTLVQRYFDHFEPIIIGGSNNRVIDLEEFEKEYLDAGPIILPSYGFVY